MLGSGDFLVWGFIDTEGLSGTFNSSPQ